jgi:hypothetical protein
MASNHNSCNENKKRPQGPQGHRLRSPPLWSSSPPVCDVIFILYFFGWLVARGSTSPVFAMPNTGVLLLCAGCLLLLATLLVETGAFQATCPHHQARRRLCLAPVELSSRQQSPASVVPHSADPLEFVELLGQLTPPPSESGENDEKATLERVQAHLDRVLDGSFLRWLQGKVQLAKTMGNTTAVKELQALEESISAAITQKLAPATKLIQALLGSTCSGARGQLLREILVLPQDHPLYLPLDAPNRQFGDPEVDPHDFYPAHLILALQMKEKGVWEESEDMMNLVLEECKSVLRGEADVKTEEEIKSCDSEI